jgi:alpha-1,4-digalacturonate transport system permease protein
MLLNFVYAFTGGTEFFIDQRPWVGTANFEQILTCENFLDPNSCREDIFWRAVYNTAGYVVFQVSLMVVFSLLTAVVLNRKIKARGFFRSVYFYPVLLSPIVVALIWKWILQENGLFNGILVALGNDKVPFLVDAQWARFWVIIISVWAFMGFYTLILLAGLQAIPADLYEAASIDGANAWNTFFKITLPLLMPSMVVVLVLSLIRAVQIFDLVFAFTGGGPGTATTYLVQYIYSKGFASPSKQFGLAASASLMMAGVLIVLTLIQQFVRREEE